MNNTDRLIAYFSKSLPPAVSNYSITEMELKGLTLATEAFRYLLKCTDFDVFTDHAAIPQILKSKHEPATNRIKRLLERLSNYSLNAQYVKGKSLVIADYLSRYPSKSQDVRECHDIAFVVTHSQARGTPNAVPNCTPAVPCNAPAVQSAGTVHQPRPRGRPRRDRTCSQDIPVADLQQNTPRP